MTRRLGRWQQMIVDALDQHETIGLQTLLEHHLDRRPTRAESIAAQRAARLLANAGLVNLAHTPPTQFKGRQAIRLLVVTRPDIDPTNVSDEALRVAAAGSPHAVDRTDKALAEIVNRVTHAANQIDDVHCSTSTPTPPIDPRRPSRCRCASSPGSGSHCWGGAQRHNS